MLKLTRAKENPILTPTSYYWENMLVFNPGASTYNNQICLLYRALGTGDEISRLGLAKSLDGIHFERNQNPCYAAEGHKYETLGIEDVRLVEIDGTYHLVYTAVSKEFDEYVDPIWIKGEESKGKIPRIGMSTTKDFVKFKDYDIILPHITGKDASLFPKKINNEYWLLYRVNLDTTYFAQSKDFTNWEKSYPVFTKRPNFWDNKRVGIGSPPIFTEKGWLLFYHGVDENKTYRLGVIFLDLNDPRKVIYRSNEPVFEPEMEYEKQGFVSNVVFTCGAVEKNDQYYVYYGAADTVIGLATVYKKDVLNLF